MPDKDDDVKNVPPWNPNLVDGERWARRFDILAEEIDKSVQSMESAWMNGSISFMTNVLMKYRPLQIADRQVLVWQLTIGRTLLDARGANGRRRRLWSRGAVRARLRQLEALAARYCLPCAYSYSIRLASLTTGEGKSLVTDRCTPEEICRTSVWDWLRRPGV